MVLSTHQWCLFFAIVLSIDALVLDPSQPKIEKLAIIRPFSKHNVKGLLHAFDEWDTFLPCDISELKFGVRPTVQVDVFLSYSQTFESFKPARDNVLRIIDDFTGRYNASGWQRCITSIKSIEANIDPKADLYASNESHKNRMWVHGPNQQFVNSMETILGGEFGRYDAVFVMENDVIPVRNYWLDSLLADAEKHPFMILGSKYDGDSWEEFRSELPLPLQHHINGNAVYNATHPLLKKILNQLKLEGDTPYHAVPYDYRISQILVEGMLGIPPDLPPDIVNDWSNAKGLKLERNTNKFRAWWNKYGRKSGETGNTIIRESGVIANYAGTNLLPRHMESIKASLIHGATHYASWSSFCHEITLVVSEWHDGLASQLLSQIDTSNHPFSKVVLMVPHNMAPQNIDRLSSFQTNIEVSIKKRNKDSMDICNAPVDTEYFMMTNAYHVVSQQVDLLFTNDRRVLPVIPFTRADHKHCLKFKPCLEAFKVSKLFDKQNTIIVHDFDMLFKTDLRDEFCNVWRMKYDQDSMPAKNTETQNSHGRIGPTATAYTSYLSMEGLLDNFYGFSDRGIFSKRDNFIRIISEEEERNVLYGDTPLSNYIMEESSVKNSRKLPSNYMKEENSSRKRHRYLDANPSITPPHGPIGIYPYFPSFTPPKAPLGGLSPHVFVNRGSNRPSTGGLTNRPSTGGLTNRPSTGALKSKPPIPLTIYLGPSSSDVAVTDENKVSSRVPTPGSVHVSTSQSIQFFSGRIHGHILLSIISLVLFV